MNIPPELRPNYAGYFGDSRLSTRGTEIFDGIFSESHCVLNQCFKTRSDYVGACRFFQTQGLIWLL